MALPHPPNRPDRPGKASYPSVANDVARLASSVYADDRVPDSVLEDAWQLLNRRTYFGVRSADSQLVSRVLVRPTVADPKQTVPLRFIGLDVALDPHSAAIVIGVVTSDQADLDRRVGAGPAPAVLASATVSGWQSDRTGREVLTAAALAIEVHLRVNRALAQTDATTAWDRSALSGVFGATMSAGLLGGLVGHELAFALGLAASQTLGVGECMGTMAGDLHAGMAAANGILSASLVRNGFTANLAAFDGELGALSILGLSDIAVVFEGFTTDWLLQSIPRAESVPEALPRLSNLIEHGSFRRAISGCL
jgi:2-methylcitrate dehydratase PrpD